MRNSAIRVVLSILLIIIIVLISCRHHALLNYRRVKADYASGKIKNFVQRMGNQNGAYLCEDDKKTIYLLLNGPFGKRGQKVPCFSNVKVVPSGNVINISYQESLTKNDISRRIDNRLLYRIKLHKNFNLIKLFKNGRETHFDNINL